MATEKAAKGFGAGFMHWYESYRGKKITGMVYSLGASVVIVGALFKILHLPGASEMLFVGMMVEALLFAIGCLDKPHPEFHWEAVFPQLLGYGTDPQLLEEMSKQARPSLLGAGVVGGPQTLLGGGAAGPASAGPVVEGGAGTAKVPTLKDEDLKALKDGIADLAKTATQFAELGKVADKGVKLGEKLAAAEEAAESYSSKIAAAGAATDSYAAATTALAKNYEQIGADVKNAAEETKAYKEGVQEVGKKLASLNSVYELQLQKQVADLNGIYGNMLNALA